MKKSGFNLIYTKIIDLYESGDSVARMNLISELQGLPSNEKILRFIGGNEGTNLGYVKEFVDFFIEFCKEAGVNEIFLRVEIDDFQTGLKHYLAFNKANIQVTYIDFGNEDYYNVRPQGLWESLLFGIGTVKAKRFRLDAEKYVNKFIDFSTYCKNQGYPEIKNKLVWNSHIKGDAGTLSWHNTLKNKLGSLGYKKCTIHLYGDIEQEISGGDYFGFAKGLIDKNFEGLELFATEYRGAGFHRLSDSDKEVFYLSRVHFDMTNDMEKLLDNINVIVRLKHTLFHWDHYEGYYATYWFDKQQGTFVNKDLELKKLYSTS